MSTIEAREELNDDQRFAILVDALVSAILSVEKASQGGRYDFASDILKSVTRLGDEKLNAALSAALQKEASSQEPGYGGCKQEISILLSGGLNKEASDRILKQNLIEQIEIFLSGTEQIGKPELNARNLVDQLVVEGFWSESEAEERFQEIKRRVSAKASK